MCRFVSCDMQAGEKSVILRILHSVLECIIIMITQYARLLKSGGAAG